MSGTRDALALRAQYVAVRAISRLPPSVQVKLSGEPPVVVDGQTLDPQIQLVRALRRMRGAPNLVDPTIPQARARFRREVISVAGPKTPVAAVRDIVIDGAGGSLRLRHYAPPAAGGPRPLTVFLHGGGFTIGDVDTHDEPCRLLCHHAGVHVLSVDYRLAPEHPFPAALDDTRAALRWARANAESLGADAGRVAVGGDSAGANLSTVAARLDARDGAPTAAQLLVYPPTDHLVEWPSVPLFGETYFLTRRDREVFTRSYVHAAGASGEDPRISPLRAPDLHGLPPALVVTAGFDLLRDEAEAYAAALERAGTPTRLRRFPSLPHGFVNVTGISPAAHRAMVEVAHEWRSLLDTDARR